MSIEQLQHACSGLRRYHTKAHCPVSRRKMLFCTCSSCAAVCDVQAALWRASALSWRCDWLAPRAFTLAASSAAFVKVAATFAAWQPVQGCDRQRLSRAVEV